MQPVKRKRSVKPALFGDLKLVNWDTEQASIIVTMWGDQTLDLTRVPAGGRIDITSYSLFGELEVKVRPDTRVHLNGFTLFGDVEETPNPPINDNQLDIHLTRYALFGDTEIDVDDD